jgi:glutamine synthetase
MAAAGAADPAFCAEQEYSVLDPFTGLPPGVFPPGALPIYAPGAPPAAPAASAQHSAGGRCDSAASSWAGASGSPAAAAGESLAASLAGLPGAAAARLLLGGGPPAHPHGSPAARRARALAELHMRACVKAGLRYAGSSLLPGGAGTGGDAYYSYRLGPCAGVEIGDQISVSRFLLRRLSDELEVPLSLAPGAACALEFSSAGTRSAACDALSEMQHMLSRLQGAHADHAPGRAGPAALRGGCPCPPPAPFTVAIGDRRAAISIPTSTLACRAGPFVDRRAAADCDPYLAAALLVAGALGLPLPPSAVRALAAKRAPLPAACAPAAPKPAPGAGALAAALAAAAADSVCSPATLSASGAAPGCGAATDEDDLAFLCSDDDDDDDDEGGCSEGCSDLESSRDLLISEICRIDRATRRACKPAARASAAAGPPLGWRPAAFSSDEDSDSADYEGEEDDSACSAMASAASSPGCGGPLGAACCAGDVMRLI